MQRRWMITFGFGLVHGFGFSFALRQTMQFAGSHLLASLLSFNIGVELAPAFEPPGEGPLRGLDVRGVAGRIDGARHRAKRLGDIGRLFGADAAPLRLTRLHHAVDHGRRGDLPLPRLNEIFASRNDGRREQAHPHRPQPNAASQHVSQLQHAPKFAPEKAHLLDQKLPFGPQQVIIP